MQKYTTLQDMCHIDNSLLSYFEQYVFEYNFFYKCVSGSFACYKWAVTLQWKIDLCCFSWATRTNLFFLIKLKSVNFKMTVKLSTW